LDSTLRRMGFEQSPHEAVVYRWRNGGNVLLVSVYVDDLVITATKDAEVAAVEAVMYSASQLDRARVSPPSE
jgi:hypothetical protein